MVSFCWIQKVISSAKTYSLWSGQHIINIPDEFDEQLLQEAEVNSAKPAQAKSSSNVNTILMIKLSSLHISIGTSNLKRTAVATVKRVFIPKHI